MRETSVEKEKARWTYPTGFILAERTGLEPATPGVTGRYSNRLNYRSSLLLHRRASVDSRWRRRHTALAPHFVLASPRGFEPLYSP
jgi:hypothetical protein